MVKNGRRGTHTWNITIQYHRCPQCGKIIESREDYIYRLGKYEKTLRCERCKHLFKIIKPHRTKFGPLWGYTERDSKIGFGTGQNSGDQRS